MLVGAMVTVAAITGYFLKNYADLLVEKLGEKLLDAVAILVFG